MSGKIRSVEKSGKTKECSFDRFKKGLFVLIVIPCFAVGNSSVSNALVLKISEAKYVWTIQIEKTGKEKVNLTNEEEGDRLPMQNLLDQGFKYQGSQCKFKFSKNFKDISSAKKNAADYIETASFSCTSFDGNTYFETDNVLCFDPKGTPKTSDTRLNDMQSLSISQKNIDKKLFVKIFCNRKVL